MLWILLSLISQVLFLLLLFKIPYIFLPSEEPLHLFVISEGGTSIFKKSFSADNYFSDQLISGYLHALDLFGSNILSESGNVKSIVFQEKFNLLINKIYINSLSIRFCYIYKGMSYYAPENLNKFIKHLYEEESLITEIVDYARVNKAMLSNYKLDELTQKFFVKLV